MTAPKRTRTRAEGILAGLGLVLAACAGISGEGWTLEGEPGLMTKVRQYYSRNATEEAGRCTWPIMEGVTRETVLEDTPERLEVLLRYRYRDFVTDADDDCSRLRPGRCFVMVPCQGFAERSFTIERTGEGARVVAMSGERRYRRDDQSWSSPRATPSP